MVKLAQYYFRALWGSLKHLQNIDFFLRSGNSPIVLKNISELTEPLITTLFETLWSRKLKLCEF